MTTFVLCHGGWAGGWQWRPIADLLRAKSHSVFTPTFTGVGERIHLAHPDIDLDTYITDIINVIRFEALYDVVLVGYSFSGMVITGVADRISDRLSHLVYLDACVPQDGQSFADLLGAELTNQVMAIVEQQGDGWQVPHIPNPGEPVDPQLTPQPIKTSTQPISLQNSAELSLPRSFIYCTEDKDKMPLGGPISQAAQIAKTDPGWHYYELETDHHPIENQPQKLVALLDTIASQTEAI